MTSLKMISQTDNYCLGIQENRYFYITYNYEINSYMLTDEHFSPTQTLMFKVL